MPYNDYEPHAERPRCRLLDPNSPAFWAAAAILLVGAALALIFVKCPSPKSVQKVKFSELSAQVSLPAEPGQKHKASRTIELSEEDAAAVLGLLGSGRWREGDIGGTATYGVKAGGDYLYDHDGHLFFDPSGGKYLTLSFEEWARINAALGFEEKPFSLPNAVGGSNEAGLRVGVSSVGFPRDGSITVIFDNLSARTFGFGDNTTLFIRVDGMIPEEKASAEHISPFGNSGPEANYSYYDYLITETGDGKYMQIFPREGSAFSDVTHIAGAYSFVEHTYSLDMYGDLEPGQYRLYLGTNYISDQWVDFTLENGLSADIPGASSYSGKEQIALHLKDLYSEDGMMYVRVLWQNFGTDLFLVPAGFSLARIDEATGRGTPLTKDPETGRAYSVLPGGAKEIDYCIGEPSILVPGKYLMRLSLDFSGDPDTFRIEFRIRRNEARLAELRECYPEYFAIVANIVTVFGLDSEEPKWVIVPGDRSYDHQRSELLKEFDEHGLSTEDMQLIVDSFPNGLITLYVMVAPEGEPELDPEIAFIKAPLAIEGELTFEQKQARIAELKERFPELFDLPTENRLYVYVWQRGRGSVFLSLSDEPVQDPLLNGIGSDDDPYSTQVSINDMKLILSTYDIDPERITVVPAFDPLSSYRAEYSEGFMRGLRELLGLGQ